MATTTDRRRALALGVAALACVAAHVVYQAVHQRPHELLWTCHVAALVVAIGLLAGSARTSGVGLLLLLFGAPLWLLDLATGGELVPTSLASHVGGVVFGIAGVRVLGLPRGTWGWALVALGLILAASRLLTAPAANINLVFAVYPGWEGLFPSHTRYLVTLGLCAAASAWTSELLLRRFVAPIDR